MIKAHKGPPPIGWENVPGMAGFIREKKATKKDDNDLMGFMRTLAEREMAKSLNEMEKVKGEPGKDATPEMVAQQVAKYLIAHPPPKGDDGKNATPAMVDASVREWLTKNPPKPGKDGSNVTPDMVASAVKAWIQANPPKPGKDGANATPQMVAKAVKEWFAGNPQEKPKDGVGIKDIKSFGSDVQIELTDGRKTKFRIAGGGGGTPFGGGGGGGGGTITVGAGDPTGAGTDGQLYIDASVTPPILWAYTNDAWSVVGGAGCEPTIRQDASYPIAYAGKATKIMKLDYSVAGVVTRSKATTTDLDADWPNRASLTYTPC